MKVLACRLALGALLVLGAQVAAAEKERVEPLRSIVLTSEHPAGYFPIESKTLTAAPPILALSFPKVVNPKKTGIEVSAYLSYQVGGELNEESKILIGNVALYPSDQPAGFLMRASRAFAQLKKRDPSASNVRLLLEMKRVHEAQSWTGVRVTVRPPQWKTKPSE